LRSPGLTLSWLLRVLLLVTLPSAPGIAFGLSVAFINPGKTAEPYWTMANEVMQQAAASLDVELEILTTERDYLAQISLIEELGQRSAESRPDYLIIAAEKSMLPGQLEAADAAGIPVFLAFNSALGDREKVGYPRQRFSLWLGSLTPDAEEGGYLAARALISHAIKALPDDSSLGMIALAGDRSTHTSRQRNQGLLRALEEFPQVTLHQQVYADWSYGKALGQSTHLLRRYPQAQLVWSANDLQAFAVIEAIHASGRVPGKDVFVSAVNATEAALEHVLSGELTALTGGHHMAGAWAIVLLYDYHHGLDFIDNSGNGELQYSMFSLIEQPSARYLLERRRQGRSLDFCPYSRACNPARDQYDFSFNRWLDIQ